MSEKLRERLIAAFHNEQGYGYTFESLSPETQLIINEVVNLKSRLAATRDFLEDLKHRPYVPPWLITGLNSALCDGAADTETNNGTIKEVPTETGEKTQ